MTPKEKAKELVDKMMYYLKYNCQPTLSEMVAKQCALITVDEVMQKTLWDKSEQRFWTEVKQEIEKL
jgi:hypothetical protein